MPPFYPTAIAPRRTRPQTNRPPDFRRGGGRDRTQRPARLAAHLVWMVRAVALRARPVGRLAGGPLVLRGYGRAVVHAATIAVVVALALVVGGGTVTTVRARRL